jgi:hypothetical protein
MEMRREEHFGARRVVQILGDRPGDRKTVEGAGAASDLVEQQQAPLGQTFE